MFPSNSILGVATIGRHHLVESRNTVSLLELNYIVANFVNNTRDVVSLVGVIAIGNPFCGIDVSLLVRHHDMQVHVSKPYQEPSSLSGCCR